MAIGQIQPFNYTPQQQNPLDNALKGLQIGSAIKQGRLASDAQEKAQLLKAQYSTDVEAAFLNPTPKTIAGLTAKYPGQREAFKQSWELLNTDQQQSEILQTGQVYSALLNGKTEIAKGILEENITASENSGKDSSKLKNILNYIDKDPTGAAGYTGLVLSSVMGEKDFAKTFETLGKERRAEALQPGEIKKQTAELKKQGAELGLKNAQTNKVLVETRKLGTEATKAVLELEAWKKSGGVDPDKKFDQEEKLRKEYTSRTKNFVAAQDAFTKIRESANAKSGAGDVALLTSFMKMLDPGSVVRETEFATAQNTSGLLGTLKNALTKAKTGVLLQDEQRREFLSLADRYMKAANKQEKIVRDSLGKVVKNYNLNSENVFNVDAESEEEVTDGEISVTKSAPSVGQETIVVDF